MRRILRIGHGRSKFEIKCVFLLVVRIVELYQYQMLVLDLFRLGIYYYDDLFICFCILVFVLSMVVGLFHIYKIVCLL